MKSKRISQHLWSKHDIYLRYTLMLLISAGTAIHGGVGCEHFCVHNGGRHIGCHDIGFLSLLGDNPDYHSEHRNVYHNCLYSLNSSLRSSWKNHCREPEGPCVYVLQDHWFPHIALSSVVKLRSTNMHNIFLRADCISIRLSSVYIKCS